MSPTHVIDYNKSSILYGGFAVDIQTSASNAVPIPLFKNNTLLRSAAAVVAVPHDKWGESPFAFVELKNGFELSSDELRGWCKHHLAGYKIPSFFYLGAIGKTSTGKVQKGQLRKKASEIIKGQTEK